ncbi:hypothetical protein GUY44_28115 [Pimelobacter simplex]|uniref:Uncharacterized protein n=1 Tax=Nocardioides simplex TaxID=2045 RepID=A0A0A1DIV3_NOCSI|nr:hypothetical protein [Pimelobacter simplex]AIY16473.1 hypothetical protein KR76_06315 [Pimelobacter simplex]MCG8154369.1 hypothetical protein [Pimelobacter simplex]GEB11804.1 hypothetical protein NSI01_01190 [Pimelobacter simplex]SFN01951.1 hypothetical protein SAMN05421671_4665 [Pimelobacter simplex]
MNLRLRQLLAAVAVLQAPLWAAGVALCLRGDVPDPVPTHWGIGGEVDGTLGLGAFTTAVLAVVVLASLVALGCIARAGRGTALAGLGAAGATWFAALPASLYVATLLAAEGAARADDVRLPVVSIVLATVLPFVAALVVHRLLPGTSGPGAPVPVPASSVALADGERVVWVGQASSRRLLVAGIVLGLGTLPLWFAVWPAALATALAAVAVAWVHVVTARVDDAGVAVSWGPAQWPRVRIDLADIAAAEAAEIEPLRWGGWGYRRATRGRAAVARRGPGLVLTLRDGQQFAATVDRPEAAAELVNALVGRLSRTAR